jgi:hypothetical protein
MPGEMVMGAARAVPAHLAAEMAATLWRLRWFVAALMAALAAKAAAMPAYAWLARDAVAALRLPEATLGGLVADLAPVAAAVLLAVACCEFAEKIASKAMEARILVNLQRTYLERRLAEDAPRDVSQVLFGCEVARKGFEAVYKDGWRIPAEITGVLAWQLTLGAEWVPLMLAAVLPALACVWLLGHRLEAISGQILGWQRHIAATTGRGREGDFAATQERIFRGTLRFEVLKWLTERGLDAMLWSFVGASALLAWYLAPALLPGGGEIAGAAAFLVNLRLLMKPLSDIGKVYVKWREASPAIAAVYGRPERLA